jgi:hypothetical protein
LVSAPRPLESLGGFHFLEVVGLPVLRRRKSTFIHGAEDDARDVIDHLASYLASTTVRQPGQAR